MVKNLKKEYFLLNEDSLKEILINCLSNDFIIKKEVPGYHLLELKKVRIDFLLFPKQHMIDKKFEPVWFGCEVKSPAVKKKPQTNIMNLAKQCIDYTESKFIDIIPSFVVMFPGMPYFFHAQNAMTTEYKNFLYLFKSFIQRFNVGTLDIISPGEWSIRFGSQKYYSTKTDRGNVKNLGTKRKIGSI